MANGFYRDGDEEIKLPHEPIPLAVFLIVEEAMRVAWQRLKERASPRIDLRTAEEDEVTHDFYEVLYDEVFGHGLVDGFDEERFKVVTRESKLRSFDGSHLDKMPDLLVSIAGRSNVFMRSQDWLFVECKPVGASHTVGVHYGAKGIARFIRGEYAWAMPNALMVGYASPGYSIDPKLIDTLTNRGQEFEVIDFPRACPHSTPSVISDSVFITSHRRTFDYVETKEAAPPICLRHLWLKRI